MPGFIVQRAFRVVIAVVVVAAAVSGWGVASVVQERSFQNLQVLGAVPPGQVELIMQAISLSLGVECVHCHEPGAFEQDTKPPKDAARAMIRMVEAMSLTTFEVLEVPSCWTCHRGSVIPEIVPPPLEFPIDPSPGPFSSSMAPAGEIYENVIVHASLPANELRDVMASYTRALGVGCDHCHTPGDWASDAAIVKQLTRVMSEMQGNLSRDVFEGQELVSCWTCHRGETRPQSNMPAELIPALAND
jgi:hypothetical protein